MNEEERQYFLRCGIPWKLINATFETFEPDSEARQQALYLAQKFARGETVFMIACGESGTGKSHLGAACLRHMESGVFQTLAELMTLFRSTYGGDGGISRIELLNTVKEAAILVLDEIGCTAGGNDEVALIEDIIGFRYDRNLATVLLSNASVESLAQYLGIRLMDRIKQSCTILPAMKSSRRTPIRRADAAPLVRFTGRKPGTERDPALWQSWLTATDRQYMPFCDASIRTRDDYHAWSRKNPNHPDHKPW